MRSEQEKMLAGELYLASDPDLVAKRLVAHDLIQRFNATEEMSAAGLRERLLGQLLHAVGPGTEVIPPFFCDYGEYLTLGARVFLNADCVILDCASVEIADDVLLGPGVHIYAATHPVDPAVRRRGLELAAPVTIGAGAWIGGGAIIGPGVTIGADSTIGAGSVVTRDVPPNVVAVGNPCRVLRTLPRQANGPPT